MYWIAKIFQATGVALLGWGFIKDFPAMMPRNVVLLSVALFAVGWIIQTYMLRK